MLPHEVVDYVLRFSFPLSPESDVLIWKPTSTGIFSVASAYEVLRPKQQVRRELTYVWSASIPLKISFFFWRLLNFLLPFPEVLEQFGFHLPSKCYCCSSLDSIAHCFFDCSFAHAVWSYFTSTLNLNWILQTDFRDFLNQCWFPQRDQNSRLTRLLPLIICWAIWKCRCAQLYSNITPQLAHVLKEIMFLLQQITLAKPLLVDHAQLLQTVAANYLHVRPIRWRRLIVSWQPPPTGYLCLNVDGSSLGNPGPSSGAFVVRNDLGSMLYASSIYMGHQTNFFVELEALLRGVRWCHEQHYIGVHVQTDSQVLVQMLHRQQLWPWKYQGKLQEVWEIMQQQQYQIRHVYRETNAVADALAKHAAHTTQSHVFHFNALSPHVRGLVILDSSGFPYIRCKQLKA